MERAFSLATTDALYRGPTDANAFPGQSAASAGLWVTADLTFFYQVGSTYSAITTDGVVYEFDGSGGTDSEGWIYCTRIYNEHGDDIEIAYATGGQPGAISTVSDALGRTVSFGLDANGNLSTMSYVDSNGGTATVGYTVTSDSGRYVLENVALPTGETTDYTYDPTYGEIETVYLPTGGTTTYTFHTIDTYVGYDCTSHTKSTYPARVIDTKTVSAGGSSTDVWTYDVEDAGTDPSDPVQTTDVGLPTGGVVRYSFIRFAGYTGGGTCYRVPDYALGLPYQTAWFDSDTATMPRRWEWTDWGAPEATGGNYIELSSTPENPYDGSSHTAAMIVPVWRLVYLDPGTYPYTGTIGSDFVRYENYNLGGSYDDHGNLLSVQTYLQEPVLGATSGYLTQEDVAYAFDGNTILDSWNRVRLVSGELTSNCVTGRPVTTTGTSIQPGPRPPGALGCSNR